MNLKLNKKKSIFKNLTSIYGIGSATALTYCKKIGLNQRNNPLSVKKKFINSFNKWNKHLSLDKKLKFELKETLNLLYRIRAYRGICHKKKKPARGQRTHTNAKTKKKFKF